MASTTPTANQRPAVTLNSPSRKLDNSTTVAIIGVGYVGEHLMEVFSPAFNIIAYDVSTSRIEQLRIKHQRQDHVKFSCDERDLEDASHFLVCVPTTLELNGQIDSSHVRSAINILYRYVVENSIVVIESTVAVGMTRKLLGPLAKSRGILVGMSPERIDPGRIDPPPKSIPKVVSGLDDVAPGSLCAIKQLYETVFDTVVPVSKPEVAEMSKLYENCQRTMAIAYANEMADACHGLGIDPFEVARTAASKPFGYLPVYPSLGIGGHCLPVNPVYLTSTCKFPLLQQAHERMMTRPSRIASHLLTSILDESHRTRGARYRPRVLVVGVGFKAGQSDLSHSPGLQLLNFLRSSGEVDLMFCDPLVSQEFIPEVPKLEESFWKPGVLQEFNTIVVAVKQPPLDYDILRSLAGTSINIEPRDWAGNYNFSEQQSLGRMRTPTDRLGVRAWLEIAHDTHQRTVHGFTQFMIDQAREYELKIVTVGECLNDPEENW
ncbi:UDP-glucose 6-dehydrogenase [Pyrenophora seminiperda CCB06]|uniref:UDP-glucose 6-dehydrogenase n=1 Tax=Pyrenophora seminiperda CCB06 TaxID=1302712 RepID=A0A3M7LYC6_9PLEO|nr:UDP-glucose 6-dehydrogenase [Pyrenophora seminiperda CCB06]